MPNYQGFLFRPTNEIRKVPVFGFFEGFLSKKRNLVEPYFRENGPGGVMHGAGGPCSGPDEPGVVVVQVGKRGLAEFDQLQPALPPFKLRFHSVCMGKYPVFYLQIPGNWNLNTGF